jgi:hypothetical protein
MPIDQDKFGELLGTFVTDLGATIAAGSIVVGPEQAGFTRFRRAAGTPFNTIYEARL